MPIALPTPAAAFTKGLLALALSPHNFAWCISFFFVSLVLFSERRLMAGGSLQFVDNQHHGMEPRGFRFLFFLALFLNSGL
jgi:apolipoprotein N-acyltransferase